MASAASVSVNKLLAACPEYIENKETVKEECLSSVETPKGPAYRRVAVWTFFSFIILAYVGLVIFYDGTNFY